MQILIIFLNTIETKKLSTEQISFHDIEITRKDLYESMKSTKNES